MIVGLGNPGDKFAWTRHNFGFLALDFYLKRKHLTWGVKPHQGAITCLSDDILFVKPQDFYNLSGVAVATLQRYYKIDLHDILVICDDFNLDFGTIRYRERGSAGGNNGLASVIKELHTEDFQRLRLGTENKELHTRLGDVNFVLSKFTDDEKATFPDILARVEDRIDEFSGARSN